MLIKAISHSADAGPGGWVGLKRKLLHLDVDGSGAVNAEGGSYSADKQCLVLNQQAVLRCLLFIINEGAYLCQLDLSAYTLLRDA